MELTHVDEQGHARMVDVSGKPDSERVAVARGRVLMKPETLALITKGQVAKGDVRAAAELAGVTAAKRTWELIPLCHQIVLTQVLVDVVPVPNDSAVEITATVRCIGKTGVEIEALTAVAVAGLTVYDMCKAVDRGMTLENVHLVRKSGGRTGEWVEPSQHSDRERLEVH
jgi:cyclic pyranopterin phosphate synthase